MSSYRARSLICLLLLLVSCIGAAVPQEQHNFSHPNVETSAICERCSCNNGSKTIRCDPSSTKLTDVSKVRIPAEFNVVDMSNNALKRIHDDSFVEGFDVTELNLDYNQISSIAAFSFVAFKNLTRLSLSHNHLATLEDDSFAGLSRLEKLDISVNKFKRINPEYLAQLTNLKYLFIDDNRIEGLHGFSFRNNSKLTQLSMSKLSVANLDNDLFKYTPKIQVLDLEDNFFETVPNKALSLLQDLESLKLSGNPIAFLGPFSFPKLPKLQQLVLHNMAHLKKIEIFAFSDLAKLRDLKIQFCKALYYIHPRAFALDMQSSPVKYPRITHLVIHDTSITTLSEDLLHWDAIEDLDLGKNKFHCNCNLSWAVDIIKQHEANNMNIRCNTPDRLAGQYIYRLQPTDMLCDDYTPITEPSHHVINNNNDNSYKSVSTGEKAFSVLHFIVIVMFAMTVVLSILLVVSVKRKGFLYRKLGKPQPVYSGGENVLYMRTTIDNY